MEVQFYINNIFENVESGVTYESLREYFKTNYYNKIFVKKITDELVLICNNFETGSDIPLYNECKSIVVQTGPNPKVVSYTHDNIDYLKISQYVPNADLTRPDFFEESFEGTMVSTFSHGGNWYFTTSRCGSIDSSYYYDKTKSFGSLFDDCVRSLGYESREHFAEGLNPNLCYYWVIVHHANKYVVDYTERFGPEYSTLVHVITRNQSTMEVIPNPMINTGIIQPQQFSTYQVGLNWIIASNESGIKSEGLVVKRFDPSTNKTKLFKIHSDKYWLAKSHNPNYPSRWFGYLDIFKRDDPTFRIGDFQAEKGIVENITIGTKQIDVTGMIYLLHKGTSEVLFEIICHFTDFDHVNKRFHKKNLSDYEYLKSHKFGVLRKQLSTLQGLISKQTIRSSADIATHLRKYVSVEDFIGLLGCVEHMIMDKSINYIQPTSKNYKEFVSKYLELISNA
jgi:hypothetical protein